MRNISFALTTAQFLDGSKTVTRRLGWKDLRPGQMLCAVEKCQGLKRGEHVKKLGGLLVLDVRREELMAMGGWTAYSRDEVEQEGFPDMVPDQFIRMFCNHNRCTPETVVTRIEFEKL